MIVLFSAALSGGALVMVLAGIRGAALPLGVLVFLLLYQFFVLKKKGSGLSSRHVSDNRLAKENKNRDFLTGLYNRAFYMNAVSELIKKKSGFSIFNIDLNNFKAINDVHGHDVGDLVLKEVGARFRTLVDTDIVFARFGGDEFALLYKTLDEDRINTLGKQLHNLFVPEIVVSESEFNVTASVGVSRYPIDSENSADLFKLADIAMYHAKKQGLTDHYLISPEFTKKLEARKKIARFLKTINMENDLFLEYQPRFDFSTGALIGVEALVRWNHKDAGLIMPSEFINVAEELDIVKDITRWTFITALHQIRAWNESYNRDLVLSLNVSNNCIHNKIFFTNLKFMLEEFNIKPQWLAIELTEFSISISPTYMNKLLLSIHDLGVAIHLDDFGTGCTSLTNLNKIKITLMKIDNEFIHLLGKDAGTELIVKSIILLAHSIGIEVAAEGVETAEQYNILKAAGCNSYQGFYTGVPLLPAEFEKQYLKPV